MNRDRSFSTDPEHMNSEKSLIAIAAEKPSMPPSRRVTAFEDEADVFTESEMLTSLYDVEDVDVISTRALTSEILTQEQLKPLRGIMAHKNQFFTRSVSYVESEELEQLDGNTFYRSPESTYDTFPDVTGVVTEDFDRIKDRQTYMVERAKNKLAKLFQTYVYNGQEDSQHAITVDEDDVSTSKSDLTLRIEDTYEPMQQKASLDWRVVALFDNYMVKETKREVAGHPIGKKIQGEAVDEFFQQQKEAEEQVTVVKRKFEDYLNRTIQENAPIDSKETDAMLVEMFTTFTAKALNDLQEGQNQSNKQVDKAKLNIRQQLQVFATNPAGRKTEEEIESEEYVKQALTDFQEKVRRDLVSTKNATDKIANRTKEQLQIPFTESHNVEPPKFPIQDFSIRARTDFQAANVDASSTVTAIKQKLKDFTSTECLTTASTAGPNLREFNRKTKEEFAKADASMKENVSYVKENVEKVIDFENPDDVTIHPTTAMDTFLSDFQETDKKMKNDVDQIKDKVEETGQSVKKVFKK